MAKLSILAGSTSKLLRVFIQNNNVTTGAGLTGLTSGSSGLTAYYIREGANSTTVISLTSATLGTFTSSGFIEVDATNMPGVYEIGIPNAAIAASAKSVLVYLKGATNMAAVMLEIELTAVDNQNANSFGLAVLPASATPGAANGLFIAGSNAATTANITGNLTGNVSGSVGSVTAAVTLGTVNSSASNIKKNTALAAFPFLMTDSTNHAPLTGLTVAANRSLDGGAFSTCTNSVSEVANGWYKISLAAADLNANTVGLKFTATGADDRDITIITQP